MHYTLIALAGGVIGLAGLAGAAGVVTIDNLEGTPQTPGGPNYLEWTMVSNSPTPALQPYNTTSPIRGGNDILVTGDTTVNGDEFRLRKQFVGGVLCGTFGNDQTYMGVRVKQQSFSWSLQLGFNCSQDSAAFRSEAVSIPAGTGYYDAIIKVTNSGTPTWGVSAGSPTNGAQHYVQSFGIVGAEITATLPNGTGSFSMQFDEISFTDPSNQALPAELSAFQVE